jgi:hypothetical protein
LSGNMTYMPSNGGNVHQGWACLQRGLVAYRPRGISQQVRQSCLGHSDLVWSADGVYRKEESGRSSVVGSVHAWLPAMWPMWDHVTVLSPVSLAPSVRGLYRRGVCVSTRVRPVSQFARSRIPAAARGRASRCGPVRRRKLDETSRGRGTIAPNTERVGAGPPGPHALMRRFQL